MGLRGASGICLWALAMAGSASAGIELVALPARDRVELTVYRELDLTLVRERRTLTFAAGTNRLEFSWAGTRIDPTSLELGPADGAGGLTVLDRSYPPRLARTLVWTVESREAGPRPVEISYFTAGVAWSASWQAVAAPDGRAMELEGDVRVVNRSGEDFEAASVRLVVGHVRLVETIAALAAANDARAGAVGERGAMGRGGGMRAPMKELAKSYVDKLSRMEDEEKGALERSLSEVTAAKEIMKEGLADQFLFAIPGAEDLKDGWTLRLPSVRAAGVPFTMVYKYDPERWGGTVHAFFTMSNTEDGKLGREPLPDGAVQVFRRLPDGRLAFAGRSAVKYVPVGEKVELDLGADPELALELKVMARETRGFAFDRRGNVADWEDVVREVLAVRSGKPFPVAIEVLRHFPGPRWTYQADRGFEKVDADTVKLALALPAGGRVEVAAEVDLPAHQR